jgi:XTP/dITP diphosphohydrolase
MKIVLATNNRDKVREIRAILAGLDLVIHTLDDFPGAPEVVEDGTTLEENALKKAREIRAFTGMSALADDSGLEVDALGGAPGVYSSRFAGEDATYEDNNRKLLGLLESVADEKRSACFRCCMALALEGEDRERAARFFRDRAADAAGKSEHDSGEDGPDESGRAPQERGLDSLVTEGRAHGRITRQIRGRTGFGYDPVFEVPESGLTFAEIPLAEKNLISHRYRALVEMRELMIRSGLVGTPGEGA